MYKVQLGLCPYKFEPYFFDQTDGNKRYTRAKRQV